MNTRITILKFLFIIIIVSYSFNCNSQTSPLSGKPGPCIDMASPLPYNPDAMYNGYFEYSIQIVNGAGIPGVDLPNMYLYAYPPGNFNTSIAISSPLVFRVNDNLPILQTNHGELKLTNVDPFYDLNCQGAGTGSEFYQDYIVTIIALENGSPEPYQNLHPELFPSSIFTQEFEDQTYHLFHCTQYYQLQSDPTTVANYSEPENTLNNGNVEFTFFPNPTIKFAEIKFLSEIEKFTLEIFNSHGKRIHSEYYSKSTRIIDLNFSELPKGSYFISIAKNDSIFTKKVLKI